MMSAVSENEKEVAANLKLQLEYERNEKLLAAKIGIKLLEQNKLLSEKNCQLQETAERLESELKSANGRNEQQAQKIAALRLMYSESEDFNLTYCDETEKELKSEIKHMRRMFRANIEQLSKTTEELRGIQMMYQENEHTVSRLSQDLKNAKDQVRKLQKKHKQLSKENQSMSQQNMKLRKTVENFAQQKHHVTQLKREKRTLIKENRQLRFCTPQQYEISEHYHDCSSVSVKSLAHHRAIITSTPARSLESDMTVVKLSTLSPLTHNAAGCSVPLEYYEDMEKMKELIRELRREMEELREEAAQKPMKAEEFSLAQELRAEEKRNEKSESKISGNEEQRNKKKRKKLSSFILALCFGPLRKMLQFCLSAIDLLLGKDNSP